MPLRRRRRLSFWCLSEKDLPDVFDKLTVMHCRMLFTGVKGGVYMLRLLLKRVIWEFMLLSGCGDCLFVYLFCE